MIFAPTDRRPGERLAADLLAQLADDVHQLTEPWTRREVQRWSTWTDSRNKRRHQRVQTLRFPSLLEQLRAAVHAGSGVNRSARPGPPVPGSRPPIAVDAADALAAIYVGIGAWVAELDAWPAAGDPDWAAVALRGLVGRAAGLPVAQGERLAADARAWWRKAATQSGWNARQLLDERGDHG